MRDEEMVYLDELKSMSIEHAAWCLSSDFGSLAFDFWVGVTVLVEKLRATGDGLDRELARKIAHAAEDEDKDRWRREEGEGWVRVARHMPHVHHRMK